MSEFKSAPIFHSQLAALSAGNQIDLIPDGGEYLVQRQLNMRSSAGMREAGQGN